MFIFKITKTIADLIIVMYNNIIAYTLCSHNNYFMKGAVKCSILM